MYSPLKEIYGFNKYVNTLRVKMVERVRKRLKRVRKTTKNKKLQET